MGGIASCTLYNKYRTMIWVKFDTDKRYVVKDQFTISGGAGVAGASASLSVSATKTYDWSKIKADFSPVPPNEILQTSVDCRACRIVYVTIVGDDEKPICTALGKTETNLIVLEDGRLRSAVSAKEPTKVNPWLDMLLKSTTENTEGAEERPTANIKRGVSKLSVDILGTIFIKDKGDETTPGILGMAVTENGTVLLTDFQNKKIKSVSPDNRVQSVLLLSEAPRSIAILDADTAVAAGNFKMLYTIDITDPRSLSLKKEREVPYRIRAIVSYRGFLVVTCLTEPRCTQMISVDGDCVWSVSETELGQELFSQPESITITTMDNTVVIVVTDLKRNTFTVLRVEDGMILKTINVYGKGLWGITADNDDNIYVCYVLTKEVFVWSNDFKENKILLMRSQLEGEPRRIVYSSVNKRFYVSYRDVNNTIGCYQLNN